LLQIPNYPGVFNRDTPLIHTAVEDPELRRYRALHFSDEGLACFSRPLVPIAAIKLKHEMRFGFCLTHFVSSSGCDCPGCATDNIQNVFCFQTHSSSFHFSIWKFL